MAVTGFSGPAITDRVGHDVGGDVSRGDASGEQVEHRYLPSLAEGEDPTRRSAVHLGGTRREEWSATTGTCPSVNAH
jgi:hypothetical protein